jgi:undecaprenyl-diphosphatase
MKMTERSISIYFDSLHNPCLDYISYIISDEVTLFILWFSIFCILYMFNLMKLKETCFYLVFSLYLYRLIDETIFRGALFYKMRPFVAIPELHPIGPQYADSSFPSGHVLVTTIIAVALIYNQRKFLIPAIIFTLIMCLSRIYNGMHWVSDTIGGIYVGFVYAYISVQITRYVFEDKAVTGSFFYRKSH